MIRSTSAGPSAPPRDGPFGEPFGVGGVRPDRRRRQSSDRTAVGLDLPGHGKNSTGATGARVGGRPRATARPASRDGFPLLVRRAYRQPDAPSIGALRRAPPTGGPSREGQAAPTQPPATAKGDHVRSNRPTLVSRPGGGHRRRPRRGGRRRAACWPPAARVRAPGPRPRSGSRPARPPNGISTATPKRGGLADLRHRSRGGRVQHRPRAPSTPPASSTPARSSTRWPSSPPTARSQPYLAQSITPNADYTVWTITMRPNVVFHNGDAVRRRRRGRQLRSSRRRRRSPVPP